MQRHFNKVTALVSLIIGVGLILGYIENLVFPQGIAFGIKIGISNIVVLFSLMFFGKRQAFVVAILKSVFSALLFSSISAVIYSFAGIVLSVFFMNALKKKFYPDRVSLTGISIAGSAVFNIGQVIAATVLLKSFNCIYVLVYMLTLSIVTGFVTGYVTQLVLKRLKRGI